MPERYADWFWEDLPESAQKAAQVMGYTRKTWDAIEKVAYHEKKFDALTNDEKRAAVYLGKRPIDYKLNRVWWEGTDELTKKHAQVLGWDQHKWDESWNIKDVECYSWWWQDATSEQREALEYFGYNQNLWDGAGEEEHFDGQVRSTNLYGTVNLRQDYLSRNFESWNRSHPIFCHLTIYQTTPPPGPKPNTETRSEETKADEEKEEEEDIKVPPNGKPAGNKKQGKKPMAKPDMSKFSQSQLYGAESGEPFDHGNNRHIDEITICADKNMVHGIAVKYFGKETKSGSIASDGKTLKLRPGEFITAVKVRATKQVHSLTFITNRGTSLGPCGGQKGDEVEVKAPPDSVLCGLIGNAGRHVNGIGFKWGPSLKKK
jgi:hypothetical protein